MDRIWLNGVLCRSRVGVPTAERRRPQKVLVDVGLETDVAAAAAGDDFRLAVDYQAVETAVRSEAETGQRALVETMAASIAARVLGTQPMVRAVTVRVHKTPAVMPRTREVVVEVRRERAGRKS